MPDQLTPEDIEFLKSKGIDPSTASYGNSQQTDEPSPETQQKQTSVDAIGNIGRAHAGSYLGGAGGMAAASWLLGPEAGLPASLILGGIGAFGGSMAGEKAQELALGDTQKDWEQKAQQAEEEHPIISAGTDIVGSALAGGGKFNLSNLRKGAGQLLGRNALTEEADIAAKELGLNEAISSTGQEQLAGQQGGREALAKIAMGSVINPAINTGLDLATGHMPTIGGIASQAIGGALFSEPSKLGEWMHRFGSHQDEPLPETNAKTIDIGQSADTVGTPVSVYTEKNAQGNYSIGDKLIKEEYLKNNINTKAELAKMSTEDALRARQENFSLRNNKPVDDMRQEMHQDWLKQQIADSSKIGNVAPNIPPPNETGNVTEPSDQTKITSEPTISPSTEPDAKAEQTPAIQPQSQNEQAELVAKTAKASDAVNALRVEQASHGELSNHPDVIKAQQLAQSALQEVQEAKTQASQRLASQEQTKGTKSVNEEPSNMLRIVNKDTLLPQTMEDNVPKVTPTKEEDAIRFKVINDQMKNIDIDSPEFQDLWKEKEDIKNRNDGYVPGTEPKTKEPLLTKTDEIQDDWDTRLSKLKVKDTGQMYGGIQGLTTAVWNGSIDAVRLSIKAGKAIHEAIKDGIEWIKNNHPKSKFDENEYTQFVNKQMLKENPSHVALPIEVIPKVNRMGKVGGIVEPLYDRIAKLGHHAAQAVSDAFKNTSNETERYIGESWNRIKSVMDKNGFTKDDGKQLDAISDYENRNGKSAPDSMFHSRAQRAVYNVERAVYNETGQRRIANNEPVYRNGVPTNLKQDPFSHPTPLAPKVAQLYKENTDLPAMQKLDKEFIDNAISHGRTPEQAASLLKDFKGSIMGTATNKGSNMNFFGGARLAQGTPLPKSFTVDNYANRIESYYKRQALDNAFYKHVESNPTVMAALGETKDAWRRDIPPDKQGSIANNPVVRAALNQFQGEAQNPTTRLEGSITNLASTLFVGSPVMEMHKIASNVINGALALSDNPMQAVKTAIGMIKGVSSGIEHATENGVIKMTARSVSNFFDNNATVAERIQALAQAYRNISSLGGRTDKWNTGLMQAGFESVLPAKIIKANNGDVTMQQMLKKFDPNYKIGKTYNTKEIQQLASEALGYVHGTRDGRTMPPWMLNDSELSGFFKLAHWSISQTNRFMSDVYTPATKGNFTPLAVALLGSTIGGYVIRQMREELQGKHGNIPDIKEIEASQGGLSGNKGMVAYNLISACQYAGFAGILSQAAKYPIDRMMKNTPQGAVFPLDEIASDLNKQIGDFTSAKANDPNFDWGDATVALMTHILTTDIQLSRIGFNHAVNSGLITGTPAEKKMLSDKLGQMRRFDMVSNLPYDDQEPSQANPYMNVEQKKFKLEQDLPKAMSQLPSLIDNIFKTYQDRPDVMMNKLKALKQNAYETFPSLETAAPSFGKYMTYLTSLKGQQGANSDFADYMKHKIVNEVKASAVP